jgi:SAM-dependent methyltransferase
MGDAIREHNRPAAALWTQGGSGYDEISFQVSDALAHAVQRLWPRPGEKVLDVATGTGWSARNAARWGAEVTAVDIGEDLLAAARDLSAHIRPEIDYQLADAENLPFGDGAFDRVISTFGVMFAGSHEAAAGELARVCRPGGRMVLATWATEGAVAEFFALGARHSGAPPPAASPMLWGDREHVSGLLGDAFELSFEPGVNEVFYPDAQAVWELFTGGFGPVRALAERLQGDALDAYRDDFVAYHDKYAGEHGLHIKRDYLVVIADRK